MSSYLDWIRPDPLPGLAEHLERLLARVGQEKREDSEVCMLSAMSER